MKKILVHTDLVTQSKIEEELSTLLPKLDAVVKSFDNMQVGNLTTSDLAQAVHNPEGYFDAIINSLVPNEVAVKVGQFTKRKTSVIQDLELPDNRAFIIASNEVARRLPHMHVNLTLFQVVDGSVVLDEAKALEFCDTTFRIFAENARQHEFLKLQNEFIDSLKKLDQFTASHLNENVILGQGILNTKRFFTITNYNGIKDAAIKGDAYRNLV